MLQNQRLRTMVIPREHGAWGLLLVPLATGAIVSTPKGVNLIGLALFVVAALTLFWMRTPVEAWLGTTAIKAQSPEERGVVARLTLVLAGVAIITIAAL